MSEPSTPRTVFGPQCCFDGELHVRGDLQIDCQCDGLILVDGTLEVREAGHMKGRIRAGAARISGTVEGDIVGEQGVAVIAGATVTGRIFSSRLLTAKGATLRAEVFIGPEAIAEAPAWAQRESESAGGNSSAAAPAPIDACADEELEPAAETVVTLNVARDESNDEAPVAEPSLAEADETVPINTVPTSIRAVLQRRPRVIGKGGPSMQTLSIRQSA